MEARQIITVRLWADVKPTENLKKVQKAFTNLCPPVVCETKQDSKFGLVLLGIASGPDSISLFAKKFREQRILEAVRQQLLKSIQDNAVVFGMQRQAAFMNRFHLCDLGDYSAMGPIRVEIQAINIQDIIDYIAPPTIRGKPQLRNKLKLT
jgi:predicted RNA binding protein with dsRBD fold (UPF0201 family)